jgi:hypothetical protein
MRTRVETGTAYELLGLAVAAVVRYAEGGEPIGIDLERKARAAVDTLSEVGREPLISLVGFVAGATETPSAESLIAALRGLESGELLRVLIGYHRRAVRRATDPAVIGAALDGDRAAAEVVRASSFPDVAHWHQSVVALTGPDRSRLATRFVDALDRLAGEVAPALEAGVRRAEPEVAHAKALLGRLPTDLAIEHLAAGGEIAFARAIGQNDVVVVPHGADDHVYAIADYGSTLVVSYPAPTEVAATMPPSRLIPIGQALGDERRLRILRALAAEALTVSDLAAKVGMPRSSLQYHVAILREAGLVGWAVDDAESGPLALRRSVLGEIESGLKGYLGILGTESGTIRLTA